MAIDYKTLGNRIKTERLNKGTTQEHFAESLDVSVGYISQIERGITKVSLERLSDISEYLECDITLLISGINSKDSQYLDTELENLYRRLNAYERKMLALLLQQYIDNRTH